MISLLWKIFFGPLTARLPQKVSQKSKFFKKSSIHSENTFFDIRGRIIDFLRKMFCWPKKYVPLTLRTVTPPLTPSTRSNHQSARKSRFRCFVLEMFFDPADIQASKQTIFYLRRFSTSKRKISKN